MTTPKRYRKKPVEIEAMQWNGGAVNASPVIDWILNGGGTARYVGVYEGHYLRGGPGDVREYIVIDTLEGAHRMDAHDYAIRGVIGEFYPCKPDVFEKTYESAEENEEPQGDCNTNCDCRLCEPWMAA